MKNALRLAMIGLLCGSLVACKKPGAAPDAEQTAAADLGGVRQVEVDATGSGVNHGAAIVDAISNAVQQVNGVSVALSPGTKDPDSNAIRAASGGSVQGYKVLSESQSPQGWTVKLKVQVNKYVASADAKLPKVAVAFPRTYQPSYVIGDQTLPAGEASAAMMSVIGDAVRRSNRFVVISHDNDEALNEELAHVQAGTVPPAEMAKLGQRLSADVLIIPEIRSLNYHKSTRKLLFSGRDLNSYAGGVDIGFSVVNVATGQTVLTDHFTADFPATPPSVYGAQKVGIAAVNSYLARVSDQFTQRFVLKYFPIAVVKLDGDAVVLNQGAAMLKTGETYQAIMQGEDVKDPQTGQSLGRLESTVGTVQITRVEEKMAFGKLTGKVDLAKFKPGAIQLRATSAPVAPIVAEPAGASGLPAPRPVPAHRVKKRDAFDAPFD
jgi:hypothetical protein